MDGKGQYVTAQGDKYEGLWRDDVLVELHSQSRFDKALLPESREV